MRYIDGDELKERLEDFSKWCRDERKKGVDFVLDCPLPDTPTEDVVPRAEVEKAKQEVAREIFEEIDKIIDKHHSECYEYEDGDECDTAITYISYISCDIAELRNKYIGE